MRIPHRALDPDTLRALLEEMVTRDGTDYGNREWSLEEKVAQALHNLEAGHCVLDFDSDSRTCVLLEADAFR